MTFRIINNHSDSFFNFSHFSWLKSCRNSMHPHGTYIYLWSSTDWDSNLMQMKKKTVTNVVPPYYLAEQFLRTSFLSFNVMTLWNGKDPPQERFLLSWNVTINGNYWKLPTSLVHPSSGILGYRWVIRKYCDCIGHKLPWIPEWRFVVIHLVGFT